MKRIDKWDIRKYTYYRDIAHFIGVRILKQKIMNNEPKSKGEYRRII